MNIQYICAQPRVVQTPNWQGYTKNGENEHTTQSGNTAARGSQSIFVDDTHTRETEEGGGRQGQRNTGQLHSGYTKSKTSSFSKPGVWNIIQAVYSSR